MPEKTDHNLLIEVHACLLGTNGQGGLVRNHEDLKKDYYKFKRTVIIILAFVAGGGGIGVGFIELLK